MLDYLVSIIIMLIDGDAADVAESSTVEAAEVDQRLHRNTNAARKDMATEAELADGTINS